MLKVAAIFCVLVVCYAQPPPIPERPVLPGTFYGRYSAYMSTTDRFGHTERRGTGWRAYNLERGMGVRNTSFVVSPTSMESFYRLERYDMGIVFDVHPTESVRPTCDHSAIAGSMPNYWNWVEYARFDGMRKWPYWDNPTELAWWMLEVSGETYSLGVFPESPDRPAVFWRRSEVDNWVLSETYESFEVEVPSTIDFEIPNICQLDLKKSSSSTLDSRPAKRRPIGRVTRPGRRPSKYTHWRSIALHRRNMRLAGRKL